MLASIAHRVPPAVLRAVGAGGRPPSPRASSRAATTSPSSPPPTPRPPARLHAEAPAGYEEDPSVDAKVYEALHIAAVFERADEFDVISNQFDFLPLVFSRLVATPVVTTIHGFSSERILPVYRAYDDVGHYVSISDADRHPDLHLRRDDPPRHRRRVVLGRHRRRRLPAVPRPDPPRQGHPAPRSRWPGGPACRSSSPASCTTPPTTASRSSRTSTGRRCRYVGPVGPAERDRLLGGARALLHLIDFDEPFGLSVVESLAAGHARDRPPARVDARARPRRRHRLPRRRGGRGRRAPCTRRPALDRGACRADAVARFSADRMVGDYEALFTAVAAGRRRAPRGPRRRSPSG